MEMAFTPAMKEALKSSWTFILERLDTNILWEHLDQEDVFLKPQLEYIQAEKTPRDQARKLLRDLEKRPAESFWKFIQVLYDSNQRLIAQYIMSKYKDGDIPRDITLLQQKFSTGHMESGHQELESATGFSENWSPPTFEKSEGGVVCTEAYALPMVQMVQNSQQSPMETDAESPPQPHLPCSSLDQPTKYARKKGKYPSKVYTMESSPRGIIIFIDNEVFHSGFTERTGTRKDCEALTELFQKFLKWEVVLCENLTAQQMEKKLKEFINHPKIPHVDACAVAVFSHGWNEDIIFGTDGEMLKLKGRDIPKEGTYITVMQIREILSSRNCLALSNKPKLIIVQACRGVLQDSVLQDSAQALPNYETDVVLEARSPHIADDFILYATLKNFVAYRNRFVPMLCQVFREYAQYKQVQNMVTELNDIMSKDLVNAACMTISEGNTTLRKEWFLNPPNDK